MRSTVTDRHARWVSRLYLIKIIVFKKSNYLFFFYYFISFCLLFFSFHFLHISLFRFVFVDFALLSLVSFYFVFISLISFRFVSFSLISFRFVSFLKKTIFCICKWYWLQYINIDWLKYYILWLKYRWLTNLVWPVAIQSEFKQYYRNMKPIN